LISKSSSSSANNSNGEARAEARADAAVINICINADDIIHHVTYLGPAATAAGKLAGLVGLPFSYLAGGLQLPAKQAASHENGAEAAAAVAALGGLQLESGQDALPQQPCVSMRGIAGVTPGAEPGVFLLQQDVLQQLSQPWAQVLFHDGLVQLRQQLLQGQSSSPTEARDEQGQGIVVGGGKGSLEEQVQDAVVQLLQRCGAELPFQMVLWYLR
jgi:hypothetical protein